MHTYRKWELLWLALGLTRHFFRRTLHSLAWQASRRTSQFLWDLEGMAGRGLEEEYRCSCDPTLNSEQTYWFAQDSSLLATGAPESTNLMIVRQQQRIRLPIPNLP